MSWPFDFECILSAFRFFFSWRCFGTAVPHSIAPVIVGRRVHRIPATHQCRAHFRWYVECCIRSHKQRVSRTRPTKCAHAVSMCEHNIHKHHARPYTTLTIKSHCAHRLYAANWEARVVISIPHTHTHILTLPARARTLTDMVTIDRSHRPFMHA